jgi:hypothetical protein
MKSGPGRVCKFTIFCHELEPLSGLLSRELDGKEWARFRIRGGPGPYYGSFMKQMLGNRESEQWRYKQETKESKKEESESEQARDEIKTIHELGMGSAKGSRYTSNST